MVIISIQEMVPLQTSNVVYKKKDRQLAGIWLAIFQDALNSGGDKYVPVVHKLMVGTLILMFVKSELAGDLSRIKRSKVMTGFSGMTGNRGSVSIHLDIHNSSFSFISAHLENE